MLTISQSKSIIKENLKNYNLNVISCLGLNRQDLEELKEKAEAAKAVKVEEDSNS